jgi:repressor LexA
MATRTRIKGLTARQHEVIDTIDRLSEQHGYPPTFRELGNALDISSTNGVISHLKPLKALGFVRWEQGKPRTLVTTLKPR